MSDEARLQIHEFTHLSYGSLTCTVRCLSGVVRVGDAVRLVADAADEPVVDGLTVTGLERYRELSFVDPGMTASVTASGDGRIDVAAIRAAQQRWSGVSLLLVAVQPPSAADRAV